MSRGNSRWWRPHFWSPVVVVFFSLSDILCVRRNKVNNLAHLDHQLFRPPRLSFSTCESQMSHKLHAKRHVYVTDILLTPTKNTNNNLIRTIKDKWTISDTPQDTTTSKREYLWLSPVGHLLKLVGCRRVFLLFPSPTTVSEVYPLAWWQFDNVVCSNYLRVCHPRKPTLTMSIRVFRAMKNRFVCHVLCRPENVLP